MEARKRQIQDTFDLISTTYDEPLLRFFNTHASTLVRHAQLLQGARVLDVATGTGKVALAAARAVGSTGQVIGIDLSEGMLAQARSKASGLPVEFRTMDAEHLEFEDATFDAALCGFGVFFFPNIVGAVREIHRVLRPGGRLTFSTWTRQSFEPMREMTAVCLEGRGIPRLSPPPEPWMECREPGHLRTLLEEGNFQERQVMIAPEGYFISAEDWWTFAWGTGTRRMISRLPQETIEDFKTTLIEQVGRLQNEHGVWLDATALIGTGIRGRE